MLLGYLSNDKWKRCNCPSCITMSWGKVVVSGERELVIGLLFAFRVFCNSSDQTPLKREACLLVPLVHWKALFMYKMSKWGAFLPLCCSPFSALSCGAVSRLQFKEISSSQSNSATVKRKTCSRTLLCVQLQGGSGSPILCAPTTASDALRVRAPRSAQLQHIGAVNPTSFAVVVYTPTVKSLEENSKAAITVLTLNNSNAVFRKRFLLSRLS